MNSEGCRGGRPKHVRILLARSFACLPPIWDRRPRRSAPQRTSSVCATSRDGLRVHSFSLPPASTRRQRSQPKCTGAEHEGKPSDAGVHVHNRQALRFHAALSSSGLSSASSGLKSAGLLRLSGAFL